MNGGVFGIDLKYLKLSGDMVRMILGGYKTQIRILVNPSNNPDVEQDDQYIVGDTIAVKETWALKDGRYIYKADYDIDCYAARWVQSTMMPEDAVRLLLRIKDARKERLQDISIEDIEKEGIWLPGTLDPRYEFAAMWDSSLSKRKRERYSWSKNPSVWVLDFEILSSSEVIA